LPSIQQMMAQETALARAKAAKRKERKERERKPGKQ